jgi:protein O-mannosyl-transferase
MEKMPLGDYEHDYLAVFQKVDLFPKSHYNLGNYYLDKKEYEKAKGKFLTAIEQDQNFADAHNNFGTVWGLLGNYQKAEMSFLKALEINPKNSEAKNNLEKLNAMVSDVKTP